MSEERSMTGQHIDQALFDTDPFKITRVTEEELFTKGEGDSQLDDSEGDEYLDDDQNDSDNKKAVVEDKHDPFNVNKIGRDLSDEESEDHLTTPMVPQHENNGFIRFMPELIQEMNRRGVRFNFGGNGQILVDGFYKNGPLTLDIKGDLIIATDKRGKSKTITELQDLVTLNFSWWKRSSSRGVYLVPERPWLDEFVKTNIVKRQVIYVPKDDEAVE